MRVFYALHTSKPVPPDAFVGLTSQTQYLRQMITRAVTEFGPDPSSRLRAAMERLLEALPLEVSGASLVAFIDSSTEPYREFAQEVDRFLADVWASGLEPEGAENEPEA